MYGFGDDAADGRVRPHLGLRRRPAHPDPRQGPGADRRCRCSGSSTPSDIVPNHLISASPKTSRPGPERPRRAGRMLVRRLTMLPIECVVRGYLVGSGWKDYQATGTVCGHALPAGLQRGREAARADLHARHQGHRRATTSTSTAPPARSWSGDDALRRARADLDRALRAGRRLRREPRHHHRRHQVRVRPRRDRPAGAGRRGADARLVALLAGRPYEPGSSPPSFDKQYVRDWLETLDWDKAAARRPSCPPTWSPAPAQRYVEAYERLTGGSFDAYLDRAWGWRREGDASPCDRATASSTPRARPCGGRCRAGLRRRRDVRAGKVFDLELDVDDPAEARRLAERDRRPAAGQPPDRAVRDRASPAGAPA